MRKIEDEIKGCHLQNYLYVAVYHSRLKSWYQIKVKTWARCPAE